MPSKRKKKKSGFLKYVFIFWTIFFALAGSIYFLFFLIANDFFGSLPDFEELENPNSHLATEVYTADSVLLGKYYSENRSNASYEEISSNVYDALIATEDARYFEHAGIDLRALIRVVIKMGKAGGGSTLSQQLAKNLFRTRDKQIQELEELGEEYRPAFLERLIAGTKLDIIFTKLKEWVIAVRLESRYTKEEILTMYLNTVEFSDNAFGIKSAARTYFNISVDSLKIEQAAVLVGMLKAPYKYNPRLHPEESISRRNTVLSQMHKYNYLTDAEADSLKNLPLIIDFVRTTHDEGLAPYFRENLRLYLKNWATQHKKPDGTPYNIYKDGLKIYTTIDSRMQLYAEEAVSEHLSEMQELFWNALKWQGDPWRKYPEEWEKLYTKTNQYLSWKKQGLSEDSIDVLMNTPKPMTVFSWHGQIDTMLSPIDSIKYYRQFLQTGFSVVDPHSGAIKAWVGGINYKYFKFDHVNINTKRQVGSTFKPLIYTLAIENGYSPCHMAPNEKITFEKEDHRWNLLKDWTPKNSDDKYGGILTFQEGLARSINTITAYVMHQLSPDAVVKLAGEMGIKSDVPSVPAICLGVADISLIEMIGAYTTYANYGKQITPFFISKIEDKNGNIIEAFFPETTEVLDEKYAYIMTQMLRNIVDQNYGTGYRLRWKYQFPRTLEIAGKTGTTQNNSDGWFIGYTPDLLGGAWVGCEDRFVRFKNTTYGQGASTALPIWAKFMRKVYDDPTLNLSYESQFEKPVEKLPVELDCSKFIINDDTSTSPGNIYD